MELLLPVLPATIGRLQTANPPSNRRVAPSQWIMQTAWVQMAAPAFSMSRRPCRWIQDQVPFKQTQPQEPPMLNNRMLQEPQQHMRVQL